MFPPRFEISSPNPPPAQVELETRLIQPSQREPVQDYSSLVVTDKTSYRIPPVSHAPPESVLSDTFQAESYSVSLDLIFYSFSPETQPQPAVQDVRDNER